MSVANLDSKEQFLTAIDSKSLSVVHFFAPWAEQCPAMTDVLTELSKLPDVQAYGTQFYLLDAEEISEISYKYKVDSVPTVILFQKGEEIDRVEGAKAAEVTEKVRSRNDPLFEPLATEGKPSLQERLKALINRHSVMVFMKGDRNNPRCGFSRSIIEILNNTGVEYDTFDIFTDEEVRQGLKEYSDWPTYPQLYVKGELIGGLDIVKDIQEAGELESTLKG